MARTKSVWVELLRTVNTPLSFYVLSLLIIEATLGIVLTKAALDPALRWVVALAMISFFAADLTIVAILTFRNPRHLLYGKEEHNAPQIDASALRDQIEDLISQNVKAECLKVNR